MRRPTPSGFLSIVLLTIAILANAAIPRQASGDVRDKPKAAAICIGLATRSRSAADFDPDDEDGDGLTNTTEQTRTLTNPCLADTDEDGLLDSWEVDPARVNPAVDKAGFNLDSDPEIEATRDEVFGPYAENGSPGLEKKRKQSRWELLRCSAYCAAAWQKHSHSRKPCSPSKTSPGRCLPTTARVSTVSGAVPWPASWLETSTALPNVASIPTRCSCAVSMM